MVGLETPQRVAGHRVRRHQASTFFTEDYQPTRRGEGAAPRERRSRLDQFPSNRSRADVDGLQNPLRLRIGSRTFRAAQICLTDLPLSSVTLGVDAAFLKRLYVIQAGRGIEGGRKPVGRSILRRADLGACLRRLLVRQLDGTAIRSDPPCPSQVLDKLFRQERFSVSAIENIKEAVAVSVQNQFAGLALPVRVCQNRRFRSVPVPEIVRGELVIPLELAGLAVQR